MSLPRPSISCLPETLPLFPLAGVVLLPGGRLPLNIFDLRHIAMMEDALAAERMIGVIQPRYPDDGVCPKLHTVGCVGKITAFDDHGDGGCFATLTGIMRFRPLAEMLPLRGYRRARVDLDSFQDDLQSPNIAKTLDRRRLLCLLDCYFKRHGMTCRRDRLEQADDETLITSLVMICPFLPAEKQALLEADNLIHRGQLLVSLLEMSVGCESACPRQDIINSLAWKLF